MIPVDCMLRMLDTVISLAQTESQLVLVDHHASAILVQSVVLQRLSMKQATRPCNGPAGDSALPSSMYSKTELHAPSKSMPFTTFHVVQRNMTLLS